MNKIFLLPGFIYRGKSTKHFFIKKNTNVFPETSLRLHGIELKKQLYNTCLFTMIFICKLKDFSSLVWLTTKINERFHSQAKQGEVGNHLQEKKKQKQKSNLNHPIPHPFFSM